MDLVWTFVVIGAAVMTINLIALLIAARADHLHRESEHPHEHP